MAEKLLKLTITRVDGPVFAGEVISVVVPGVAGDMQILANHIPIISPLKAGKIQVKTTDGSVETFELNQGTLEVSANHVTILI